MKAFLMHVDSDFDLAAELPAQEQALTQDLELETLLRAMAAGDELIFDVAKRALLLSLPDPEAIAYRQRVLTECLEHPDVVRELYILAERGAQGREEHLGVGAQGLAAQPAWDLGTEDGAVRRLSSGGCARWPTSTPTSSAPPGSRASSRCCVRSSTSRTSS